MSIQLCRLPASELRGVKNGRCYSLNCRAKDAKGAKEGKIILPSPPSREIRFDYKNTTIQKRFDFSTTRERRILTVLKKCPVFSSKPTDAR
jgi:hypothetical protein